MADDQDCTRTWAAVRVWSRDLDSSKVTEQLHLEPSWSYRRGDQKANGALRRYGYWEMSSQSSVTSTNLEEHLLWLLDKLEPRKTEFLALVSQRIQTDIFCFWGSKHGYGGPKFSPDVMGRMAALQLSLNLDVYFDW